MLPSGHADKEKDLAQAAQRELQEEAGYRAQKMTKLWSSGTKENFDQTCHIYLAEGLTPSSLPKDDDELMEVHVVPLGEALGKVLNQDQIHFPSAVALMKFLEKAQK